MRFCSLILGIASPTQANPFNFETKLTAFGNDAAAGDLFGSSVEISGKMAIIGARRDDHGGNNRAGAAYLFNADPLSGTYGTQLTKLTANSADSEAFDEFGISVGISNNIAIVGAWMGDDVVAGNDSGSAFLFDADPNSIDFGKQLFKLIADDSATNDRFGVSVGISNGVAIVGAPFWDVDEALGDATGSAYLFNADPGPGFGDLLFKLTATGVDPNDRFGSSVAISGGIAIVGAPLHDLPGKENAGAAYLFNVTFGNQIGGTLTASDSATADTFGGSVAITDDWALVGSLNDDHGSNINAGSAYLFDVATGSQESKLTASDAEASDFFGGSLAINGNTAILGLSSDVTAGIASGSAYLFDLDDPPANLNEFLKFTASDAAAGDGFGGSVAISGDTAIVGASGDDHGVKNNAGSAYLFGPTIVSGITIDSPPVTLEIVGDVAIAADAEVNVTPGYTQASATVETIVVLTFTDTRTGQFANQEKHHRDGIFIDPFIYNASDVTVEVLQAAPGDTDGDRKIDNFDIANILTSNSFGTGPGDWDWTQGDFTGNGIVDNWDIVEILLTNLFGTGSYAASGESATGGGVIGSGGVVGGGGVLESGGVVALTVNLDGTAELDADGLTLDSFILESLTDSFSGAATLPASPFAISTSGEASVSFVSLTGIWDLDQLFDPLSSLPPDVSDLNILYTVVGGTEMQVGICNGCVSSSSAMMFAAMARPGSNLAAPEPSSIVLAALALVGLIAHGQRRRRE